MAPLKIINNSVINNSAKPETAEGHKSKDKVFLAFLLPGSYRSIRNLTGYIKANDHNPII